MVLLERYGELTCSIALQPVGNFLYVLAVRCDRHRPLALRPVGVGKQERQLWVVPDAVGRSPRRDGTVEVPRLHRRPYQVAVAARLIAHELDTSQRRSSSVVERSLGLGPQEVTITPDGLLQVPRALVRDREVE